MTSTKPRRQKSDPPAPATNPNGNRPNAEPTPEEIAAACREIQSGWSPEEEERRRVIPNPPARVTTAHDVL
jgi:hypothetical protein